MMSNLKLILRVPPGLNSLTPTMYENSMITVFILVIDNENHIIHTEDMVLARERTF